MLAAYVSVMVEEFGAKCGIACLTIPWRLCALILKAKSIGSISTKRRFLSNASFGANPIAWMMMSAFAPGELFCHDSKKEAVEPSTLTSIGCNSVSSGNVATNCCILLLNLGWKPNTREHPA